MALDAQAAEQTVCIHQMSHHSPAQRPRLAVKAVLKQLSRAEGELAKSEGMRPHLLLDRLCEVLALEASEEEVKAQLHTRPRTSGS